MKERPILFSTPMVRAILENRKTQTRRVIKPIGKDDGFVIVENENGLWAYRSDDGESMFHTVKENRKEYLYETPHSCPYGKPGDRLWVRESYLECSIGTVYRADNVCSEIDAKFLGGWKPSVFMPRKLSRITLEITNIRVERLPDISDEDAIAEGIVSIAKANSGKKIDQSYLYSFDDQSDISKWSKSQVLAYKQLWEQINGKESWDLNPWVWVIQFRRV